MMFKLSVCFVGLFWVLPCICGAADREALSLDLQEKAQQYLKMWRLEREGKNQICKDIDANKNVDRREKERSRAQSADLLVKINRVRDALRDYQQSLEQGRGIEKNLRSLEKVVSQCLQTGLDKDYDGVFSWE